MKTVMKPMYFNLMNKTYVGVRSRVEQIECNRIGESFDGLFFTTDSEIRNQLIQQVEKDTK